MPALDGEGKASCLTAEKWSLALLLSDGRTYAETKRLLDNTDPQLVFLCFDTGHFTFSREDAVAAAKAFAPRIGHVHLKDIRRERMEQAYSEGFSFRKAVLEGCFTVPGDGFVNFPDVFSLLDESGYEGWLLVEAEQDPAKANPLEYAKMARAYIAQQTLGKCSKGGGPCMTIA